MTWNLNHNLGHKQDDTTKACMSDGQKGQVWSEPLDPIKLY